MSRHTPGPWTRRDFAPLSGIPVRTVAAGEQMIARVANRDEWEANADLIVKAPRMHALLQRMVDSLALGPIAEGEPLADEARELLGLCSNRSYELINGRCPSCGGEH